MISLETLGCYRSDPGSQRYPFPFGLLYPDRGDFVAIVGDLTSSALVRSAVRAFRGSTAFPCEGGVLPRALPGVSWSDQASYWHEGFPALMATDTAPFRYPHYHRASDLPEHVDWEALARVVGGFSRVLEELAGP